MYKFIAFILIVFCLGFIGMPWVNRILNQRYVDRNGCSLAGEEHDSDLIMFGVTIHQPGYRLYLCPNGSAVTVDNR